MQVMDEIAEEINKYEQRGITPQARMSTIHGGGGGDLGCGKWDYRAEKCGKWDYRGEKMWDVGLSL